MAKEIIKNIGCIKTRLALLGMNLTSEPLSALFTLLPFILRKELHISAFDLSLFVMLRPILSCFSFYWGAYIINRQNKLVLNLISAWVLARIWFLLFPLFSNFYYLLFASAMYHFFSKAAIPAWMEILKTNMPKKPREHYFSIFSLLSFLESILLGLSMGYVLDKSNMNWQLLFFIASLIGLSSVFLQMRISVFHKNIIAKSTEKKNIFTPWKESFLLLRKRKDFATFQMGFMIGGFALMLMTPALSIYYADILKLTYEDMTSARFIFMGIGFVISSLIWKNFLMKYSVNFLTRWVLLGFSLFPLVLLLAKINIATFFLAFLIYGVAQAGSTLLWNLSGTIFAGDQNSLPFTTANLLMLGIRGLIAPVLGGLLCDLFGPMVVIMIGMFISFYGVYYMRREKNFILSFEIE